MRIAHGQGAASVAGRLIAYALFLVLTGGCATRASVSEDDFGVLVMAHGGLAEWERSVVAATAPLHTRYKLEIAFGMADAVTMQDAIRRLEAQGVRRIGVVRLFISGDSWYGRTEQILGLAAGAPEPPAADHAHRGGHPAGHHSMAFWRVPTQAAFALSTQGVAEGPEMDAVLVERVKTLSRTPEREDVLILAHGPGDDAENERWLAHIDARAQSVRKNLALRRVLVETLQEDWPEKRRSAEARVRAFVKRAAEDGGTAIVIPFRVQGFGPYARVLDGLDYVADRQGLLPHPNVTLWIERQIETLRGGPFRSRMDVRPRSHLNEGALSVLPVYATEREDVIDPPLTWNDGISRLIAAFAQGVSKHGYRLDYSVESIGEVERVFAEHAPGGVPRKGGLLENEAAQATAYFGYYVGEVLMRHRAGRWQQDPAAALRKERRFRVLFADGTVADPVLRVEQYAEGRDSRGTLGHYVQEQLEPRSR